jgi:DNA ligase (NAD+)
VANLEPVLLSGTIVKRATLVNEDQIRALDIREGDYVYVEKGGEIIPKITSVELSKRAPGALSPEFPKVCPDCGTPLVRQEDEARWFCPNSDGCPMQIKGELLHFCGRKAMDILAGEATVDQLFSLGFAKSPADLYDLGLTRLMLLDGWREKSARRFIASLDKSRDVPFERVLFALGIRYVGETTAKVVARHFGSIDALAAAGVEELKQVPDVGDVCAGSIYEYFRDERHIAEIARLKAHGLKFSMESGEGSGVSDALAGRTIVVSGTFSISRDEIKALIEANGGKNAGSVSSKTSFLLAGDKPGPEKIKKCSELGIPVIDEAAFRQMLPSSVPAPSVKEEQAEQLSLF